MVNVRLMAMADGAKLKVMKELRALNPALSIKEAKDLTEKLPATIMSDVARDEANTLKKKLEELGATVELE